jgi:hypothetical protein
MRSRIVLMMDVDDPDTLDWLAAALGCGVSSLEDIVRWLEGGPRSASLDPSAWDNTMAALVWAITLGLTSDRVSGIPGTEEDLQRLQRVHALGIEALSGRERSPDLLLLARQWLRVMQGSDHPPV